MNSPSIITVETPGNAGVLSDLTIRSDRGLGVLPSSLTPLIAHGAIMEVLAVQDDWIERSLHGECSNIVLPTKEQAKASLWMEQAVMDGARDYLSYECHDLRIVKVDQSGELSLLICKRTEPGLENGAQETAPINGFWWSIGGRREIPKPGTELDGKFSLIDSILHKARREAGIEPADVLGVYDLGIGRTEFEKEMTYISLASGPDGQTICESRSVTLNAPQRTINRNLVVMIQSDAVIADQTVEQLSFISASHYSKPEVRAQFCAYERKFIDAVFAGWEKARSPSKEARSELN